MKTRNCIAVILLLLFAGFVAASEDEKQMTIGGFWNFDYRFLLGNGNEDVPYYDLYSRLRLRLHTDVSENIAAEVSGDFRLYGDSAISTIDDLTDPATFYMTDAFIWEAYLDIYGLGIDGLDVRIGKQRIAWGTADKMNPTDNLNPYDLANNFDFGEHIPTVAIRADYSFSPEFSAQIVWLPAMKPALMPKDMSVFIGGEMEQIFSSVLAQTGGNLQGVTFGESQVSVTLPPYDLAHSMQGAKLKGVLGNVDFSVSYFHGYDNIIVPVSVDLSIDSENTTVLNPAVETGFFEYHMAGLDFAGELAGIGWWAEGALFFPVEDQSISITIPSLTDPSGKTTLAALLWDTDPWFKATVGFDYTFSGGTYINFQYVHGLFNERGEGKDLNDYFLFKIEQKFSHDKLKAGLAGAYAVMDWSDISNSNGVLLNPELQWLPYDSLELSLGGYIIGAEGEGFFSGIETLDMMYLKAKIDF
jgi:hypothetical protein